MPWLLPSRDRPQHLQRFFDAYRATSASTPGLVILNTDDYRRHAQAYQTLRLPTGWTLMVVHEETLGGKLNRALETLLSAEGVDVLGVRGRPHVGTWIGYLQDDLIPRTRAWDRELVWEVVSRGHHLIAPAGGAEAVAGAGGAIFNHEHRLHGALMFSRKLLESTGWIFPPALPHLYADTAWEEIVSRVPNLLKRRNDVLLEHMHPAFNKAPMDVGYKQIYDARAWADAQIAWSEWQALELPGVVERIKEGLGYGERD